MFFCSKDCQRKNWKVHKRVCRSSEEENPDLSQNIDVDLGWLEDAAVTDAMIESLHEEYTYESDEDDEDCGRSDTIIKCTEFLLDLEDAAEEDMGLGVAKGIASAKALKELLVDKIITSTGEAIHNMWSGGHSINGAMQRQMKERVEKAEKKAELILIGIVKPALSNAKGGKAIWARLKDSFVDVCLSTLRCLVILMEKSPHPGGWGMQPLQEHFQVKEFLTDLSSKVWSSVLYDTNARVPADELIPIMRQLAMLDCVDRGWNWHGSWSEVLDALSNKCCGQVKRIGADDELERISSQIRKADNSMRCKLMACSSEYGSLMSGIDSAPQKWRYQLKCSAMNCSNIEDPENPHTLRCQECWYFHWCNLVISAGNMTCFAQLRRLRRLSRPSKRSLRCWVGASMRRRIRQKPRVAAVERKKGRTQSLTSAGRSIIAQRCVRSGMKNMEAAIECKLDRTGPGQARRPLPQ